MPSWLRFIRPPMLLLLALGMSFGLAWRFPGHPVPLFARPALGVLLAAGGVALIGWAALLFQKRDTPIIPGERPRVMLNEGPYRRTRNPIYLGMALASTGVALLLNNHAALLGPVFYVAAVWRLFIRREEVLLRKR